MEGLRGFWSWLPDGIQRFVAGDFPSWLAVAIAVVAMMFALRRQTHTEFAGVGLKFDTDGGPVTLSGQLITTSPAVGIVVKAKLKIGGVAVPLVMEPLSFPTNYGYRTVNTFDLVFTGVYVKQTKMPKEAHIDVHAQFSDGSSARRRYRMLLSAVTGSQSTVDTPDSPTEPSE